MMVASNKLSFICENCAKEVPYTSFGTKNRNHCPFCLASKHVDNEIGDRASICNGVMTAVSKMYKPDGEEVLVHKCEKCGMTRKNRVAGDDSEEKVAKLEEVAYSQHL